MNKRHPWRLPHRLAAYATAVGASLAAHDAAAGIVHTDFGPNGVDIGDNAFMIDLDTDGNAEFHFGAEFSRRTYCDLTCTNLFVWSTNTVSIVGAGANGVDPRGALARGDRVDPGGAVTQQALLAHAYYYAAHGVTEDPCEAGCLVLDGALIDSQRAFVGLFFDFPDGRHAGWADLEVYFVDDLPAKALSLRTFGYAYETTPGASIRAGAVPEPPALALLAAGAAELAALRRKRRHA